MSNAKQRIGAASVVFFSCFDGVNFNLGALWNIIPSLTLGVVYKSPFHADVHHTETVCVHDLSFLNQDGRDGLNQDGKRWSGCWGVSWISLRHPDHPDSKKGNWG